MIKGLIFDYGGTLDTGGRHWSNVLWDGYCAASVPIDKDIFIESYVYGERMLAKGCYIKSTDTFLLLLRKKLELEFDFLVKNEYLSKLLPITDYIMAISSYCNYTAYNKIKENRPLIEKLHSKYQISLVTNFYGNINTVLEDYGIRHCFDYIVESAVEGVKKPSPEIFSIGVSRLNIKPSEVLVIGDSYHKDIEPALAIGCNAVWLKCESWKKSEENIIYDKTICSLNSLSEIIDCFI